MTWESLMQLIESVFSPRGLGTMLWIGLAIISISLLVLMRTRWGQAKPLSKCIALSVFAHILLMGYAYGTKLILDQPVAHEEPFMRLAFVDPGEESVADTQRQEKAAWRESFATEATEPDVTLPERQATDVAPVEAWVDPETPDLVFEPQPESLPEAEPNRPPAEFPDVPGAAPMQAAPSDVAIETAPVRRQEPTTIPEPVGAPLERVAAREDVETLMVPESSPEPPQDLLDDASQLQRLSDIAPSELQADAVLAAENETHHADNRQPASDHEAGPRSAMDAVDAVVNATEAGTLPLGTVAGVAATIPVVLRLGDSEPLAEMYRLRGMRSRLSFIKPFGGNAQSEAAVEAALAWLASVQKSDGRWDANQHGGGAEGQVLGHDRQSAGTDADTGITGLAVLAFLGAGHTHFEGTYRRNVQHGLEFLVRSQQANGSLAGDSRLYAQMYCHGIAMLAVSEAYAMTGDYRLRSYLEQAVQFSVSAQHPSTGGWRYQPGDLGDMSQLGWQLMALRSAELAGLNIPARTRSGMVRFIESVSTGNERGLASYRVGEASSRTMTAEALTCRFFLGKVRDEAKREAVDFVMQELPQSGQANLYYWYYATLGLFQIQGADWQRWNAALQEQLLGRQRRNGDLAGSWDADTVWGGYGGRVYTTALAAMCLEVYYRYLPILDRGVVEP